MNFQVEGTWPTSEARIDTWKRWKSKLTLSACVMSWRSTLLLPLLWKCLWRNSPTSKLQRRTATAMTRWLTKMMQWIGLSSKTNTKVIRRCRVLTPWLEQVYEEYMIDDDERSWNPRNPNSMLRKRTRIINCACLQLLALDLTRLPFPVRMGRRGREREQYCGSLKTLNALTCSPVPRPPFFNRSRGRHARNNSKVLKFVLFLGSWPRLSQI